MARILFTILLTLSDEIVAPVRARISWSCLGSPFNYTKAWMPYVAIGQGENAPSTENLHLETEKYRIEAAVTYNLNWYLDAAVFEIDTAFILREVGMFYALQ